MRRLLRFVLKLVLFVAFYGFLFALALRGFTLLKAYGHGQKWWDAPPSIDAWDPKQRIDAAEAEARKYEGKER